jgi:hypothetical protein
MLVKCVYPIALHMSAFVVLYRPSKEAPSLHLPAMAASNVCGVLSEEKTMLAYVSPHGCDGMW